MLEAGADPGSVEVRACVGDSHLDFSLLSYTIRTKGTLYYCWVRMEEPKTGESRRPAEPHWLVCTTDNVGVIRSAAEPSVAPDWGTGTATTLDEGNIRYAYAPQ